MARLWPGLALYLYVPRVGTAVTCWSWLAHTECLRYVHIMTLLFEGRVFCANLLAKENSFSSHAYYYNCNHRETSCHMQANQSLRMKAISCFQEPIIRLGKKPHTNVVNSLRTLLNWSQTSLKVCLLFVPHFNFPLLVCQGWPGGSFSAEGTWHFPSWDKRYKYWQTESHIQINIQVKYVFFSWRKQNNLLKVHQIP